MRLITLLATPHGLKGNTAALLGYLLEGAETEGASNETIVLKGDTVLPCRGCDACHKKGKCVQRDDFEVIKQRIVDADGLILASPNYISSVSAQLKAFMDRCTGVIHCMGFWGKYGASVVTSGGGDDAPIAEYMNSYLIKTGAVPVGGVWATMADMGEDGFNEEVRQRARALGRGLTTSWRNKELPPGVERDRNAFMERMRALISYRKNVWKYEYEYWKSHHGMK